MKKHEQQELEKKALYNILAVNKEGKKEILGMYVSNSKEVNFLITSFNRFKPTRS